MRKFTLLLGLFFASQSWGQTCDPAPSYVENFESVTVPLLPACTTTSGNTNNWATFNNPGNGFTSKALRYNGIAQNANAWFFTKGIAMTPGTYYKVYYKYGNNGTTFTENLEVTFGTTGTSADPLFQTHSVTGGTPAELNIGMFPAPQDAGTYYFGFHAASPPSQGNIYIDDITIEPLVCGMPSNVQVNTVSNNSAAVSWSPTTGGNMTMFSVYQYAYATTDTPPADGTYSPQASVLIEGLTPGTTYYLFTRSLCGPVWSDWTEGIPFTTSPCAVSALPYVQDFETATVPALPECTLGSIVETGNQWVTVNNPGSGFANNALHYADSDETANAWFFTKAVVLTQGSHYKISYKYGNDGTTTTENLKSVLAISPNPASVTTTIASHEDISGGTAVSYSSPAAFSVNTSGIYYLGFNAYSDASQGSLYLDDIVIEEWTCSVPADISISAITTTGATATWEATGNPAVGYLYAFNTTGEEPNNQQFVNALTINLTELEPATTYYFFVKGICGPVIGEWSEPVVFTTPACTATTVPYSLDFEDLFVPSIPGCTQIDTAENNWATVNNPGSGFTSNTLAFTADEETANAWFFTQGVELTAGTFYVVSYKYGNGSTETSENLRVTLNSHPDTASVIGNNFATHEGFTGGIQAENKIEYFNVTTSGVYYFGFNAYSDAGEGSIYVDDFLIEAMDCGEATNLQISDVTDTAATLTWEPATTGNATPQVYQYFITDSGETPETGVNTEDETVTLTELEPDTEYTVYVRVQCGPTYSDWITLIFQTEAVAGLGDAAFSGLKVYPNPAKDVVTITANAAMQKAEVYSITGQLVHIQDINAQEAVLNLQKLSAGAYLINISGESGSKRIKIIKE